MSTLSPGDTPIGAAQVLAASHGGGGMTTAGMGANAVAVAVAEEKRRSKGAGSFTSLRRSLLADAPPSNNSKKSILEFDPLDIASQLSVMENELFQAIQPWEFLNQGWLKSNKELLSPNLLKMIRFSNKVC